MPAYTRVTSDDHQSAYKAYAIEVNDETVGIVVRDQDGYTFYAADPAYLPLDHHRFPNAAAAQKAALALRSNRTKTLRSAAWRTAS
jgi:hypothetical protein